jgi:2-amino-4-hydroxy-6-hydroxymethyldihydropteridine diphosphokinase
MARAYLSLGSNLDPRRHLRSALAELEARFGALTVSTTYRSRAEGFEGPDFLNLAVGLDTELDPVALDAWLHELEARHGRRRDVPRYSSRTLDVDIVLYDDLVLDGPGNLKIPRSELQHAFVLRPLSEIAPEFAVPGTTATLAELWRAFPAEREPLEPVAL